MPPAKLKRHYGGPVSGQYYWPRPEVTDPIINALRAGESVRQFGLRRTGKSTVLKEVTRALQSDGHQVVAVDVQGFDGIGKLVSAIEIALAKAEPSNLAGTLLAARARVNKALEVWQTYRGQITQTAYSPRAILQQVDLINGDFCELLNQQRGKLFLLVDELPYLLSNMLDAGLSTAEVNAFLASLRSWREAGLAMLLTGSIGISWLVRNRGLARDHLNDLIHFDAPSPLSVDQARSMLKALRAEAGCDWMNDDLIELILTENSAHYPSFLQFAFGRLNDFGARSADDVRRIFAQNIRPGLDKDFFDQFEARINHYDAALKSMARAVLHAIGSSSGSAPIQQIDKVLGSYESDLRDEVLITLSEDGFILIDNDHVTFSSQLVGTWWRSKPYRKIT